MPAIIFEEIYEATMLPMNDDHTIDEAALMQHVASVAAVEGIH